MAARCIGRKKWAADPPLVEGVEVVDVRCRVEMLGGLRVQRSTRDITRFGTTKNGALLAYLAYHLERPHPREVLAELLWPWSAPSASRRSLRVALASLRRQLEPPGVPHGSIIVADRFSVRLNPAVVKTDVGDFEAALRAADDADSEAERFQSLMEAVELYGGPLLPGYYQDWIVAAQEHLSEQYFRAGTALIGQMEAAGQPERAVELAQRLVALDPLREDAHLHLTRLLARCGQVDAAKRQLERLETVLRKEFGESPSETAQQMLRALTHAPSRGPEEEQQLRPSRPAPGGQPLPQGTVTFLLVDIEHGRELRRQAGREFEQALEDLVRLLRAQLRRHQGHEVWALEGRFTLAFARPTEALNCALACQREVLARPWAPQIAPLRVRMALDTGEASVHEGGYHGRVLDRATGLLLAAHGGQVLCSEACAALLPADPEGRVSLVDVGYHRLRGREVPDRLYAVTDPETAADAVPLPRAALAHRSNVPAQLTRFFGRERELQGVRDALLDDGVRMVTLTGPGGSGKTRLAIAVAEQVVETFAGAIWFVPFEQLTEPDLIAEAIVNAMGLPRSPGMQPLAQVVEVLSRQPSLLVLDSFEHLVDDGGPVVAELLRRTPTLKYLVTSRRSLNLAAETEFLVQPLPVPGGTRTPEDLMCCPSVQLLVDRAQAKRPDFQVTDGSADAIGELCDRLEGLPLAIELAAGWASVLSPARMLSQLEDRFGFLVAHERGADERHRTLQAAVDWSYELLPEELRRLFAELSVFRGGWTAEAAQAVCGQRDVLEGLRALRECSLVAVDDGLEGTGDPRYRLLETLREYGWARLTEEQQAALRQRHAEYYLALAQKARPELAGPDEHAKLKQLSSEQHNLRAVLLWAGSAEGDLRAGLRLSVALYPFWTTHGHITEARTLVNRLLAPKDVGPEIAWVRASVLDNAGYLARIQADFPAARSYLEEALAVRRELGDELGMTQSLFRLALVAMDQHDFEAAERCLARSRQICHRMGLAGEMAQCLMTLGALALRQGDHARAEARMQQALTIRRNSGYPLGEVACLRRLGAIALDQGKYAQAQAHYREALSLARGVGHSLEAARSLNDLGSLAREQGSYSRAQRLHEEALAVYEEAGNVQGVAETLDRLGQVAFDRGQYDRAQTIQQEALAIFRELGFVRGIPWTLHHLGVVALRRGDLSTASAVLRDALVRFRDVHSQVGVVASLDGLAEVARAEANLVEAVHLLAAADAVRQHMPRPAADRILVSVAADPSALRAAMGEDAFAAAWAEGQEMPLDEAIDRALDLGESS